jgi:HK97 family phage portal protein
VGVFSRVTARVTALLNVARSPGGWAPIVREPYTGAWQLNDSLTPENALANPSVFGVVSRIAQDIAKIAPPLLLELDDNGFWFETTNSAYTPVLRRPNRYQTPQQFYEQWMLSKLVSGNTYVLKERDERGVVKTLVILDPARVKPLVAPDGSVYYELQSNELAGLQQESAPIVVGAADLIHDRWNCLWHPLCGISPLYAIGGAVSQAQAIQSSSTTFFAKGGRPAGMLVAPTKLDPASAERIKSTLANFKTGEIMLTDQGMTYHDIGGSAVDSELIAQLGWTEEKICEVFGMPISILNSNKQPPYANAEASQLQYKSQCLEPHLASIAACLGDGLELPLYLSLEFDDTLLIWMDTATRTTAAKTAIAAGMSVNEVRDTYYGLGPVPGGEVPYLQQQYYPISELADRAPTTAPVAAPLPPADAAQPEAVTP